MISVGHRIGLFDAMTGVTRISAELATKVELQERYIREWLGAMIVGNVVEHDAEAGIYSPT